MGLCIVLISNEKANTTLGIHIPSNFENWQPFVVCGSVTSGVMFFFLYLALYENVSFKGNLSMAR